MLKESSSQEDCDETRALPNLNDVFQTKDYLFIFQFRVEIELRDDRR